MKTFKPIWVKTVSSLYYAGRVLSLVDVKTEEGIFRTGMYRSTGSNVDGKGLWFPFCGVAGPGEVRRTMAHTGWIIKGYIYSSNGTSEDGTLVQSNPTLRTSSEHANPDLRWTHFNESPPFDIKEISSILVQDFDPEVSSYTASIETPIEKEDAEFINTWFIKGLMVRYSPPDLEKDIKKEQEKAFRASLIFM